MTKSPEERLHAKLYPLAQAALQGSATARQIAQLDELLQSDPQARRLYLDFTQDSYSLRIWALAEVEKSKSGSPAAAEFGETAEAPTESASGRSIDAPNLRSATATRSRKTPRHKLLLVTASLAVVVLLAVGAFIALRPNRTRPQGPVVASIIDVKDCVWSADAPLAAGDPLPATHRLELLKGVAQIRFQDGALVTLQGPANLELLTAGSARLRSGVITSFVPPEAVGFQVQTETLDVIDLGTSFGVAATAGGDTSVSVFSGRVEVSLTASDDPVRRIVSQGESIRTSAQRKSIESIDFTADAYNEPLKAAHGIVGTAGACRFVAQQAVGGILPDDEQILVALERRGVVLQQDLDVNLVPKPDDNGLARRKKARLPAGTRVDCFLLQFCPGADAIVNQGASAAGRITFNRPILGLIVSSRSLAQTDELFADRESAVEQRLRGGETGGDANESDSLVISDDQRTIEVTARLRKNMDQIRVLVQASDDRPVPTSQ